MLESKSKSQQALTLEKVRGARKGEREKERMAAPVDVSHKAKYIKHM